MRKPADRGAIRTAGRTPFGLDLSMAVFDRATRLAKAMFASGFASIILVRDGEIWRSRYADQMPGEDPLTEQVLQTGEMIWIADGTRDPRFADNPLVTGPPHLRFTVAVPIELADGARPGVLSVSGLAPEPFDPGKAARLADIAAFVADEWARAETTAALARSLAERDQALEERARSEARLQLALELADVHVWELDYARRALITAGVEENLFAEGHTYASLHRDVLVTVDPRDRQAVQAAWQAHCEQGTPFRPEYRTNRADGREVWAISAVKFFTDDDGRPLRLLGATQNITASKQNELALREAKEEADAANRAKSDFLATMSHELRTPLNAILGFAEVIKDEIMGPAPALYVGYARDIYTSGRHLLDLVDDVLDISKLEAGKVELHESDFELTPLLQEVAAWFGKQAEAAAVAIQGEFGELPRVRADKRLVKQVLLNLLSNALKFTPAGGRVTIETRHEAGAGLTISVADTGIGMSAPELAVALTPFGQIDSKIARNYKGTGLGLPISRSLMKLHGGGLALESTPGQGTRVSVTLPEARVLGSGSLRAAS